MSTTFMIPRLIYNKWKSIIFMFAIIWVLVFTSKYLEQDTSYFYLHRDIENFYRVRDCTGNGGLEQLQQATRSLLSSGTRSSNTIPYLVHQRYTSKLIPSSHVPNFLTVLRNIRGRSYLNESTNDPISVVTSKDSSKHSAFRYAFWTDAAVERLIVTEFVEYADLFDSYDAAERADAARYFILLRFGGIFIDWEMELGKEMTPYDLLSANRYGCVLAQELPLMVTYLWKRSRMVSNAIIACEPNSTLMRRVVEYLRFSAAAMPRIQNNSKYRTGSFVLDEVVRKMIRESLDLQSVERSDKHAERVKQYLLDAKRNALISDYSLEAISGAKFLYEDMANQLEFLIAPPSWFFGVIHPEHLNDVLDVCIRTLGVNKLKGLAEYFGVHVDQDVVYSRRLRVVCTDYWRENSNVLGGCDLGASELNFDQLYAFYGSEKYDFFYRSLYLFKEANPKYYFDSSPQSFSVYRQLKNSDRPSVSTLVNMEKFLILYLIDYYFPYS